MAEINQDFICTECPLDTCDEESLWCAWRWATQPNKAQLGVATVRLIPKRLTDAERSRKWRQTNRERYNEVQREYRARRKMANQEEHQQRLRDRRIKDKQRKAKCENLITS